MADTNIETLTSLQQKETTRFKAAATLTISSLLICAGGVILNEFSLIQDVLMANLTAGTLTTGIGGAVWVKISADKIFDLENKIKDVKKENLQKVTSVEKGDPTITLSPQKTIEQKQPLPALPKKKLDHSKSRETKEKTAQKPRSL